MALNIFKNRKTADQTTDPKVAKLEVAPKIEKKAVTTPTVKKPDMALTPATIQAAKILIKPVVSEKAAIVSQHRQYVFVVSARATKPEIKKAVKILYHVDPVDVSVMWVGGKKVSTGRFSGQRKDWKKAIVTLKEGQSLSLYEGV